MCQVWRVVKRGMLTLAESNMRDIQKKLKKAIDFVQSHSVKSTKNVEYDCFCVVRPPNQRNGCNTGAMSCVNSTEY